MNEQQKRIRKIEKAITEAAAEVERLQQEQELAFSSDDPAGLATLEKHIERAKQTLAELEKTKAAAGFTPPAMTDKDELLQDLRHLQEDKSKRIANVTAAITEAQKERNRIEAALQQAAIDCNTEQTITLSEEKAEINTKLKYLQDMKERTEALPVYQQEDFITAWNGITEKMLPVWDKYLVQLATAAEIYENAAAAVIQMYSTLKSVQDEIRRTAAKNDVTVYFPRVFTADIDTDRLTVNRVRQNQIHAMKSVVTQSI